MGQTDRLAQFVARSSRYNIFLTTTGAVLAPRNSAEGVRVRFVDSSPAKLEGASPLPGLVNYFRGSTQALENVPTYERVTQHGVYPGIDVVFHSEEDQLEYDFIVAPDADPARIVLAFDGAHHAQLNDHGEIEFSTAAGTLTQRKPLVYQERDSHRIPVQGRYESRGNHEFALVVGKYDRAKPLIIDPTLVFFTSIGGSGPDQVNGVALDSQGNIYIAGQTASLDFPVVGGVQGQLNVAYAYRLDNAGTTTTRLNGILSSITSFATDTKSPSTVYAGTQSGLLKSTDSGANWTTLAGGLPSGALFYPILIDPTNSQVIYVVAANGPGVFKSTDAGATWTAINNGISGVGGSYFQFSGPALVIDPFQTNHLILRTDMGEFQTTDGGANWSPYSFPYGAIAFDPNNQGVVYASSPLADIPTIYKSADSGVTFNPIASLPGNAAVFVLLVDPRNSSTLYVGSPQGLFKSTDGGLTWNSLNSPSPFGIFQLMADPVQPNTLYAQFYSTLYKTIDGGATFSQLAPSLQIQTFAVSSNGASVYLATTAANNVFVTKLDPTGKTILYSTYVGGSASDQTAGIAIDGRDNVYITGLTESPDFPVTAGAVKSAGGGPGFIATPGFVFKLNPNGNQLIYSATIDGVNPTAIAIDSEGSAYVTGSTTGGLAATKGAYWTTPPACIPTGFIGCIPQADAFVFKLNPSASSLAYSTYLNQLFLAGSIGRVGKAIALDSGGNAYVTGLETYVDKLSADGSSLLFSTALNTVGGALALDSANNAYITGPRALVAKFDPNGAQLFSKSIGVNTDSGVAIALDSSGNIVIAGLTYSSYFPLFSPTQSMFAPQTGFLTKLDSTASNLLFSTYVGDSRNFQISGLVLDASGRAIISGSTFTVQNPSQSFLDAFVSEYDMSDIPSVRLDNVLNAASLQGGPVSPGEIVTIQGAGFPSAANTQLFFDQMPATVLSATATRLTAIVPYALDGKTFTQAQVQSAGMLSNPVWFVAASASPGIYSVDGSGTGQALAFNQDGTPNSLSNPAAVGSTITFYATGVGQTIPPGVDGVLHRSAPAAPANSVAIFIGGLYILGPGFNVGPATGFPADVFTVKAVIPNPTAYSLPGLVPIQIQLGGVASQGGLGSSSVEIAVKPN